MSKVLVVSGHTDLNDSVANKTILEHLEKELPDAEFDYLDRLYPDFRIDREAEQNKLVNADIIVLEFPIFWYSTPSLLQRWLEQTLQHGFSHGSTGDKLHGKKLIASFTTGAPAEAYHRDGPAGHEIEEYLIPLEACAGLCGMEWSGYIYTGGVSYQSRNDPAKLESMKARAVEHADRLIEKIEHL